MASLQVYKSRGNEYVRIVESYRDPVSKKPKIRVIKNLGNKALLEEREPGIIERLHRELQSQRDRQEEAVSQDYRAFIQSILDVSDFQAAELKNYGYLVYEKIWDQWRLDYFFNYRQKTQTQIKFSISEVAKLLTFSRLLDPSSKRRAYQNQDKFVNLGSVDLQDLYRSLAFFASQKENLESYLNKRLAESMIRDLTLCFYDVTTYYFESTNQDDLKAFGFSKDNKVNQVQVVMGLLIDRYGIPVTYELFPGNTSEFKTLEPVLKRLKESYGLSRIIITADQGLNSKANLARIRQLGYDYIMAYRIKSSSQAIKNQMLDTRDYEQVSPGYYLKEMRLLQRVQLEGQDFTFEDRFILTYSEKRAARDRQVRERLVQKAVRLSEAPSQMKAELKKGGKKYVQLSIEGLDLQVDEQKITDDSLYDGYYGIVSSDTRLTAHDIIDTYHSLWKIEESFRVMKSNLEARPIFVWTETSIQGHFLICYLALVIQRYLEYLLDQKGLDLSTRRIQEALASATISIIPDDIGPRYIKNQAISDFRQILEALDLEDIPSFGKSKQIKL